MDLIMKHEKYPPFKSKANQMQEVNISWATEQTSVPNSVLSISILFSSYLLEF